MKKKSLLLLSILALFACNNGGSTSSEVITSEENTTSEEVITSEEIVSSEEESLGVSSFSSEELLTGEGFISSLSEDEKKNLSIQGYAQKGIKDFSSYVGTSYYRSVSTPDEFINALFDARYDYTNTWDEETSTYSQTLNKEGSVHVIEITSDLNLGYFKLSSEAKAITQVVGDFASNYSKYQDYLYFSDMFKENGISQIKIENTSNLMIFSKNGAKITHAGFKINSCDNIVIRNLSFDEIWQWDDAHNKDTSKIGDYDWFGWAYFKIGFSGYIWIDHCSFGKSYDGQIDYANANYHSSKGTSFRAPYGATSDKGLSITWCDFTAGDDSKDGYIYKMMNQIEQDYQKGLDNCLYYKALRDKGISFEDIFYGLAIPQKKGFLIGDDQDYKEDNHAEYDYNLELNVSFANCKFIDFEDRIPKVRGGNVYMHNCYVDSSRYNSYRGKLSSSGASSAVRGVNSSWKCALTNQGIVCGQGASVRADNCIFLGINTLLKNNDSGSPAPYSYGGYQLNNCRYECGSTSYTGSSSDANHKFKNSSTSTLSPEYFVWHTSDGQVPYTPSVLIELDELEEVLSSSYGVGTNILFQEKLLDFTY